MSVPSFFCREFRAALYRSLPLRVVFFVADFADAFKLPLAGVRIIHTQCQIWAIFQVLYVVHDCCASVPSPALALLAFVPIAAHHIVPFDSPLCPIIKTLFIPAPDQLAQCVKLSRHQMHRIVCHCVPQNKTLLGWDVPRSFGGHSNDHQSSFCHYHYITL